MRLAPPSSRWVAKECRSVWGDTLRLIAGRLGKVAHDVEHHHPREMPPTAVQKQIALLAGLGVRRWWSLWSR